MAFQINGTDAIDNNGNVNVQPLLELQDEIWESMFSAQSSWNTDDFTIKSGSSSQTIDLKQRGVWPTTNDFRELFFEVKLTSIPSSGTYGFSDTVFFQQGTSAFGYDARAILCPSQANFINLTDRPDQGMYLHLINRRENFSVPTYSANSYYIADDTLGVGNLRSSSGHTSYDIDWESTFAGQTERIYILFPSFATSSVSWKITCRWR